MCIRYQQPEPTCIQGQRYENQDQVHAIEGDIFRQSPVDQARSDEVDEVAVQREIDDGEDDLFASVPNNVEADPCIVDLEAGRHQSDEDADVYGQDVGEDDPLQLCCFAGHNHQETEAINNDLQRQLHLDSPEQRFGSTGQTDVGSRWGQGRIPM